MRQLVAFAIIGRLNHPLLVKNLQPQTLPNLSLHYMLHTVLDIVDEKSTQKGADPYLGLLYALEDLAVYGYRTSTNIKFILVVSLLPPTNNNTNSTLGSLDASPQMSQLSISPTGANLAVLRDTELRPVFRQCHQAWVKAVMNPFQDVGLLAPDGSVRKIESAKLDSQLENALRVVFANVGGGSLSAMNTPRLSVSS